MPIFDHTYRHLERPLPPPFLRWLVIARLGIMERLGRRWFDALLVLSMIPFVAYVVLIFVELRFEDFLQEAGLVVGLASFAGFLRRQIAFAFLVTIFAGAGVVSGDLRTRALPLYLSKPLSRIDYVLGKLMVPAFFLTLVTLVPAEILLALRILTSENLQFLRDHPLLPVQVAVASLVLCFFMSGLMLALSSLSRSAWIPGLGFAIVFVFSFIFAGILRFILRTDVPLLLSPWDNLARVIDAIILGTAPVTGPPWLLSLMVLGGIMALAALVLHLRIRGVEVVTS